MSNTRIYKGLQELSWRGLTAPCEAHPYDFSHSQAERRWPYVNGAGHEWTGMDPIQFSAKLHFLNTLSGGKVWYPNEWNRWRPALFDGSAGPLVHPDLGEVNARVLRGSVSMTAQAEAGIVVDVSWTSTVDDPDADQVAKKGPADVESAARAADVIYRQNGIPYPDGVGDGVGIFEAWNQLKGFRTSAIMKYEGAVKQFVAQVGGAISDVKDANDSDLIALSDALLRVWNAGKDVLENDIGLGRPIDEQLTQSASSLTKLANDTGNTLVELMELNSDFLRSPLIMANKKYRFYKKT